MHLKDYNVVCALLLCGSLWGCGGSAQSAETGEPTMALDEDRPSSHRATTPPFDDGGEDDGVEVSGTMGRLNAHDVSQAIEENGSELTACYFDNLKRRRYIGGNIELLLVVATDGSVKSADVVHSSLGSFLVERCLSEVAHGIQFAEPEGGVAEVRVPLAFDGVGRITSWDPERIESELAVAGEKETDVRKTLALCVEETGARPPRNGVMVTAYVTNRGKIKAAGFSPVAEEGLDPVWAECAHTTILGWRLSDPRGRVAKISFTLAGR